MQSENTLCLILIKCAIWLLMTWGVTYVKINTFFKDKQLLLFYDFHYFDCLFYKMTDSLSLSFKVEGINTKFVYGSICNEYLLLLAILIAHNFISNF